MNGKTSGLIGEAIGTIDESAGTNEAVGTVEVIV